MLIHTLYHNNNDPEGLHEVVIVSIIRHIAIGFWIVFVGIRGRGPMSELAEVSPTFVMRFC